MKKRELGLRVCENCGEEFSRRQFCDRMEDAEIFLKRRHCSRVCGNSRKVLKPKSYHYRARKHRKPACECCGLTAKLHVHHLDQDHTNNDPSNLQTLCTYCHRFVHGLMARLGVVLVRLPRIHGTEIGKPGLPA